MTSHHEKFEAELAQIEETYNAKKTKFLDSSEEFNKELKKHCVPAVDDAKYKGRIISESDGGFLQAMTEAVFFTIGRSRTIG